MGAPITLQSDFAGMRQDEPRDLMVGNALWNCVDLVPQSLGAPLRKRGNWAYASPALSGTFIDGICRTPSYGAGAYNVAVDSTGAVSSFTDLASTSIGTAFNVAQNPIVHRSGAANWLVVIPANDGTTVPKSWDGTTFGNLGGSPPAGIFAEVWYDRTVLANGTAGGVRYPGRVWFSNVANGAFWDTTNAWMDFDEPVTGLASMRTAILVFHRRYTERIRQPGGAKFPSSTFAATDTPLDVDRPFEIGCADARSIVKYNDTVIWADITGVYQTDGVALKNLTQFGGMSSYWFTTILNLSGSYTLAAGVVHDTYIISIMNGSSVVDILAYDLLRQFWFRLSNIAGRCFCRIPGDTAEKVYMGLGNANRVASLYTLFYPDGGLAADADGTVTLPYFETPFYRGWQRLHRRWIPSLALQQWTNLYSNYLLVDGGAAPTFTVGYLLDPTSSSYTTLTPAFKATSGYKRARVDVGKQSSGIAFKYQQSAGSTDTRFHGLEADYGPLEVSRLAQ